MQGFNLYGNSSLGLSDPYMMYALKSMNANNPAFKAQQTNAVQNTTSANTTAQSPQIAAQSVQPQLTQKESSNAGLWITGALGAAAIIGMVKGKSINPLKYYKGLLGGAENKTADIVNNKYKSQNMTVRVVDGTKFYTLPERRLANPIQGKDNVTKYASMHDIDIRHNRLRFQSGVSKINECEFTHTIKGTEGTADRNLTVKFNNGKYEIFEGGTKLEGDALTSIQTEVDKIASRVSIIESGIVQGNISAFKGLKNVKYTNDLGDDVITVTRKPLLPNLTSRTLEAEKLSTLERFEEDSDAVQAYLLNNNIPDKVVTAKFKSGSVLPESFKVKKDVLTVGKNKFVLEDGKVIEVIKDGKPYRAGTEIADAEINRNSKEINKRIKEAFEDNKFYSTATVEYA